MANQFFRNRGGIPRSNISETELEQLANQVTSDASSAPRSALAGMLMGISHHIDEMAEKNRGGPDALDESLRTYNSKAKQTVLNFQINEKRQAEAERQARIQAYAQKQMAQRPAVIQKPETVSTIDKQPLISEHGTVISAHNIEADAATLDDIKTYFDGKFEEVNNNLKAISNLLYQVLASNSWQEEWQLSEEDFDETSEEVTDSDEELQNISESGQ